MQIILVPIQFFVKKCLYFTKYPPYRRFGSV